MANSPQCEGYSGADLSALVREAQMNALKASLSSIDDLATKVEPNAPKI